MSTVYLIHFLTPLAHARHYLGYTQAESVDQRMERHLNGTGARLLQVARERGVKFEIVRTWEGEGRTFERKLKNRKNAPKLCPVCNPGAWERRGKQ